MTQQHSTAQQQQQDPGEWAQSVSAIRAAREGSDLWGVSDALLAEVPQDSSDRDRRFHAIRRRCIEQGVKPYGVSALRQYRDVAARWSPESRIPGVSFSAHRAALVAPDPAALLADLLKSHKPEQVTVKLVDSAAKLASGGGAALAAQTQQQQWVDLSKVDIASLVVEVADRSQRPGGFGQDLAAIVGTRRSAAAVQALRDAATAIEQATQAHSAAAATWGAAPAQTQPAQTQPAQTQPAQTQPAQTQPQPAKRRSLRGL